MLIQKNERLPKIIQSKYALCQKEIEDKLVMKKHLVDMELG